MSSRKRSSESGVEPDNSVRSKKAKVNTTAEAKTDSNGDRYWEISKMRRVTISSFRGKTQVNVREYYEKDGQELPGKKVSIMISRSAINRANIFIPNPGYLNARGSICCYCLHST